MAALRRRNIDYRGVLYAGLILTPDGPRVLEYNVRFGDPETQVVLPRFVEDLTGLLAEAAAGRLRTEPRFTPDAAVCVVLAAEGYPATPRTGDRIDGLEEAALLDGVTVFHAGTESRRRGSLRDRRWPGAGRGRHRPDIAEARRRAYAGVARIGWPGMQHRGDIAAAAAAASVTTADPPHHRRHGGRAAVIPLFAAGDGGPVHRRGPLRDVARGRGAGGGGVGRGGCRPGRRPPPRCGPGRPR